MARKDRSKSRDDAMKLEQWLVEHRSEFEQGGVREDALTSAVGLSGADATRAVDVLENRDEVVRVPQARTAPPQFVLKPGRAWDRARDAAPRR